jgi:hypothetical protein
MPLCNRVDPWGRLHDDASRTATLMGNRGILHDANRRIVKRWTTKAWVACDPKYRGISRKPLFSPGNYSELFFLDEATAFAAGHRSCACCQRDRFNAFKAAWAASIQHSAGGASLHIREIDQVLHAERAARGVDKVTFAAKADSLPEGSMFAVGAEAYLLHGGSRWRWSFRGYERAAPLPPGTEVSVLTPKAIVRLYAIGFKPKVHPSADA